MNALITRALPLFALFFLFASTVAAQTLTLDQSALTQGDSVNVTFVDAKRAGEKVVIEIDDGGIFPKRAVLSITLDANGKGTAGWVVPNWNSASFQGPGAPAVTVPCNP